MRTQRRRGANLALKRLFKERGVTACEVCGWELPKHVVGRTGDRVNALNVHHVVPVAAGGEEEDESNVVLLCPNHHAVAHSIGAKVNGRWWGPKTRSELIEKLKRLDLDPDGYRGEVLAEMLRLQARGVE